MLQISPWTSCPLLTSNVKEVVLNREAVHWDLRYFLSLVRTFLDILSVAFVCCPTIRMDKWTFFQGAWHFFFFLLFFSFFFSYFMLTVGRGTYVQQEYFNSNIKKKKVIPLIRGAICSSKKKKKIYNIPQLQLGLESHVKSRKGKEDMKAYTHTKLKN